MTTRNKVKYSTYSGQTVEVENEAGETVEIELNYAVPEWLRDTILVKKIKTGWRVGYLLPDDDPDDPQNWDGEGLIGTRDRHGMDERFRDALGIDKYGERLVSEYDILREVADEVGRDWHAILRDPDINEDKGRFSYVNIKRPYHKKWRDAVDDHFKNGDLGDPDRVMLDYYEHGGRMYYVSGENHYPNDGWDTTRGGAVWIPTEYLRKEEAKDLTGEKRREMMITWAKQFCEVYNQFLAGDVYGIQVFDYDEQGYETKEIENCWGFYSKEYAEGELKSIMGYEEKE